MGRSGCRGTGRGSAPVPTPVPTPVPSHPPARARGFKVLGQPPLDCPYQIILQLCNAAYFLSFDCPGVDGVFSGSFGNLDLSIIGAPSFTFTTPEMTMGSFPSNPLIIS